MTHLIMLECADFNDVRRRFYQVPSLQDLFKTVKSVFTIDHSTNILHLMNVVVWFGACFIHSNDKQDVI